jgi:hypothetical protein
LFVGHLRERTGAGGSERRKGLAGLRGVRSSNLSLMVIDGVMPNLNGRELATRGCFIMSSSTLPEACPGSTVLRL